MLDPTAQAVQILNEALERDPDAVTRLVNLRVDCNERLAQHPSIQVTRVGEVYRIGFLGLLNGVFAGGIGGMIGAQGTVDKETGKFLRLKRFVDLRTDKLNVLA